MTDSGARLRRMAFLFAALRVLQVRLEEKNSGGQDKSTAVSRGAGGWFCAELQRQSPDSAAGSFSRISRKFAKNSDGAPFFAL